MTTHPDRRMTLLNVGDRVDQATVGNRCRMRHLIIVPHDASDTSKARRREHAAGNRTPFHGECIGKGDELKLVKLQLRCPIRRRIDRKR